MMRHNCAGQSKCHENLGEEAERQEKLADYWQPLDGQPMSVLCLLCPHLCRIAPGHAGICRVRVNRGGKLFADAYAKVTSLALDPIEKKPLHDFLRGSKIFSVGSYGCNFRCGYCQNWQISQQEAAWQRIDPEELIALAEEEKQHGNIGVAYTYNEPLINYEYVLDCARLAHAAHLKNVLVTNGSINSEPFQTLLPYIDAMNIDLKSWQDSFYKHFCGGARDPVLETIRSAARCSHVELTLLLIPGLNDHERDLASLAEWVASQDPMIVLHLTRHHPDYLMPRPPPITVERMKILADVARKHLHTVVLGNI